LIGKFFVSSDKLISPFLFVSNDNSSTFSFLVIFCLDKVVLKLEYINQFPTALLKISVARLPTAIEVRPRTLTTSKATTTL
jgi:hypothetical protein